MPGRWRFAARSVGPAESVTGDGSRAVRATLTEARSGAGIARQHRTQQFHEPADRYGGCRLPSTIGDPSLMAKELIRVVTRAADGTIRIKDYSKEDSLKKLHTQIGVDDCSTDLGLRGCRCSAA